MRLAQPEPLSTGDEIKITFTIPQRGSLTLRGVVVWCYRLVHSRVDHLAGIHWLEPNPVSEVRLNSFLKEHFASLSSSNLSEAWKVPPKGSRWKPSLLLLAGFALAMGVGLLLFFR